MNSVLTLRRPFAALGLGALIALGAVTAPTASAAVLIDNFSEPTSATTIVASDLWAAQSFTTASEAVWFDSVTLLLGLAVGNTSLSAELRADGVQGPGALLAGLILPTLSGGAPQAELLTPAMAFQPVQLAPLTTYWLVLATSADSFGWSYALGNNASGPGQLGDYRYSSDSGLSWANFGAADPYHVRIEVTPVPEPAAAWLLVAGLAVVLSRRRLLR